MKKFFKWVFLILGILVFLVNIPLIITAFFGLFNLYVTPAEKGVFIGEIIGSFILPALFFVGFFLLREK